ncbi:hypothetical protein PIB30_086296 [Stylosanthes scabra]|uniref:Protein FAR1-RELATED SEQUENCE n=1 Tax=Stylosanthes scabra TaxID=79078 RepID=A0ABU6VT86_9FABA|nr:hypothetical protein [Stylosanthes scabra]
MRGAIAEVFPAAHHRLCAWHLIRNATAHVSKPRFTQLFKQCMLADVKEASSPVSGQHLDASPCMQRWEDLLKVDTRYMIFLTNFQRCVEFVRDNEEEIDFRSYYGKPVMETLFLEMEMSVANHYTRDLFCRVQKCLCRSVRFNVIERNIDGNRGSEYVVHKYGETRYS